MTEVTENKIVEDKPTPRLVPNPDRERMVPLAYPVEWGDRTITEIRVHRVSGKQVQDFIATMGTSLEFVIPPVIDCPLEVWNVLDADDQETVEKAAEDFLPQRLRRITELILANGEVTSASSPTPSGGAEETSSKTTG